tara:strand:+ start:773 stop:2122 length:1350 start_codon:yes stop_codon:yes gene_type:complete
MSKILRRPMFRGGRVDSRGSGITSGLGYARGGSINTPKRGLVDGPGGYAGISMSSIPSNIYNSIFGGAGPATTGPTTVNTATTTGGQISQALKPQGPQLSPQMQAIQNRLTSVERPIARSRLAQGALNRLGGFAGANPITAMAGLTGLAFAPTAGLAYMNRPKTVEALEFMKSMNDSGAFDETGGDDYIEFSETFKILNETGTPLEGSGVGLTSSEEEIQKVLESQVKAKPKTIPLENKSSNLQPKVVTTEEPELTVDDYIDLLGGKKARQRDAGDMLGRASAAFLKRGARGEKRGVTDALGDFMAAETAAGPGRREKIEQTAAMLDIKDKQASKRSKEQVELFKGQEDYRNKLATERTRKTIDDQYLSAKKTEGKSGSVAIAVRNSLPIYKNRKFEVVETDDVKNRQITENDVGKIIIKGNESGTYTAIEVILKTDGTIGTKELYTSP